MTKSNVKGDKPQRIHIDSAVTLSSTEHFSLFSSLFIRVCQSGFQQQQQAAVFSQKL